MKPAWLALVTVLSLVGCAQDDGEEAASAGGGSWPDGGGAGGDPTGLGDGGPLSGPLEAQASSGTGDPVGSGSGGGSGTYGDYSEVEAAVPDCAGCCLAEPQVSGDPIALRVDDSNSFATPLLLEALLPEWDGETPLPAEKHEFLNLFAPEVLVDGPGGLVAVAAAMPLPSPTGEQLLALQVGVRDTTIGHTPRAVALLLDTSPESGATAESLLAVLEQIATHLAPDDSLGVLTAAADPVARLLRPLEPLGEAPFDREELADAVQRELREPQPASLDEALPDALALAGEEASARGLSAASVVLVSDGRGEVGPDALSSVARAAAAALPVRVVGVGVGPARSYGGQALERITDAGGGAHIYFDGSASAQAFFADRTDELFDEAAGEVRLELRLPPGLELVHVDPSEAVQEGATHAPVRGQALARRGTMTFFHVLRWAGATPPDPCAAIGWSIQARPRGADALADELVGEGALPLGDAFVGALEDRAIRQGLAVVSAANALRAPTAPRLEGAVASLLDVAEDVVAAGGSWQDHPGGRLCTTLSFACARKGAGCAPCDAFGLD